VPGSGPGTHRPFSLLVPNIKKWSAEILLTIFLFSLFDASGRPLNPPD
jgi:hypothetical protein